MTGAGNGRTHRRGLWIASAALLAALSVLLSESLFGGAVLSQADALLAFQPWAEAAPPGYEPENPLLLDQSIVTVPWLELASERLRAGELPLWNPYDYAGQPLLAALTGATFWPPHLVHALWPSRALFAWFALLHLALAGVFTLLYLRRVGVPPLYGLAGATAFALSGFNVAWLNHPHVRVALLLPFLLWCVERASERGDARSAARAAAWTGLGTALALVAGHVQTALHVALAVGLYVAFRLAVPLGGVRLRTRGLAALAAGVALGAMLAAPQLLPFARYLGDSRASELFARHDTVAQIEPASAATFLVAPDRFGRPDEGDYAGPHGDNLNYNELVGGFVGRLALLLALAQVVLGRRDRRTWFFAGLALLGALVAWQVPPFHDAFRALPVLRTTKLTRFLLFTAFGLSVLAALGLESIARRVAQSGRALAAGAFVVVAAELVAWGRGYNPAIEPALVAPTTPTIAFLEAELARAAPEPYRVLGVDNTILLPNANLFHRIPLVSGYDSIEDDRLAELVGLLTTDPRAELFVKEIRWFDRPVPLASLLGVRWVLSPEPLPAPLAPVHAPPRPGGVVVYENPDVLPRAFAARSVVVAAERDERLALLGAPDFAPRTAVLEAPPEDPVLARLVARGTAPHGEVRLVSYEPLRIELETSFAEDGFVVVADTWAPGWVAGVDGEEREVVRVDHALRGVVVRAGERSVELRYEPFEVRLGLALAALAAVLLALAAFAGRRGSSPTASPADVSGT